MITPRTIANVTAICRAGVDMLSGNGRGGLGKSKSSLEPARLLLTPNFPASELKLKLPECLPDARCSAGVNPQNKNKKVGRLSGSERSCGWVRAPSSGTGLHLLVLPSLKFTRSMYNTFLLSPMKSPGHSSHNPSGCSGGW